MTKNAYQVPVDQLQGESLDYWMYCHAAKLLKRQASIAEFETGYKQGLYRFSIDKALLADLMTQYHIRVQMLGEEWLASTESHSQFGDDPILAACRLVVSQEFGDMPSQGPSS